MWCPTSMLFAGWQPDSMRKPRPTRCSVTPAVRDRVKALLATFDAQAHGSSKRIARLILLAEPPSLDTREITDKGSINQLAVLQRRADLVADLYATGGSPRVIG